MSLHDEIKTRVKVDSELSEEFKVKVGMHQGSVQAPILFAVVEDVAIELSREAVPSELLYADDLIMMRETVEGPWNKYSSNGRSPLRVRV